MRKVNLTQGKSTIVDNDIYNLIKQHKWCVYLDQSTGYYYVCRNVYLYTKSYSLKLHRYIMDLDRGDKRKVDHINHNTLDNRRVNLRIVSNRENMQNQRRKKLGECSSKYPGVVWSKRLNKWCTQVSLKSKRIHLGYYISEKNAYLVYTKACNEIKNTGDLDKNNYVYFKSKKYLVMGIKEELCSI